MEQTRKTTQIEKDVFKYLNELRDSGITSMYAATPFIVDDFNIQKSEARIFLSIWMENYRQDGNYEEIKFNS